MKKISNYEAHEIALHLIDGGWTSEDKEQFLEENAKQDSENVLSSEAIDMIFDEIEQIEQDIREQHYVGMDDFGQDCPDNWEEIAAALNAEIDKIRFNGDKDKFRDEVDNLWERYCANDPSLSELPRPEGI